MPCPAPRSARSSVVQRLGAPICALAAISCCSACARSGRRSSSSDGTPAGTAGSAISKMLLPRGIGRFAAEQDRQRVLQQADVALQARNLHLGRHAAGRWPGRRSSATRGHTGTWPPQPQRLGVRVARALPGHRELLVQAAHWVALATLATSVRITRAWPPRSRAGWPAPTRSIAARPQRSISQLAGERLVVVGPGCSRRRSESCVQAVGRESVARRPPGSPAADRTPSACSAARRRPARRWRRRSRCCGCAPGPPDVRPSSTGSPKAFHHAASASPRPGWPVTGRDRAFSEGGSSPGRRRNLRERQRRPARRHRAAGGQRVASRASVRLGAAAALRVAPADHLALDRRQRLFSPPNRRWLNMPGAQCRTSG